MDISGIGNDLLNTYTDISKSSETESNFKDVFDKALESKDDEELMDACIEYEAYYVQQLFKEMRKTIPDGGLFEDSNEQDIYEDMLDEEYSKVMANNKGFGIANSLYKQLSPQISSAQSVKIEEEE